MNENYKVKENIEPKEWNEKKYLTPQIIDTWIEWMWPDDEENIEKRLNDAYMKNKIGTETEETWTETEETWTETEETWTETEETWTESIPWDIWNETWTETEETGTENEWTWTEAPWER